MTDEESNAFPLVKASPLICLLLFLLYSWQLSLEIGVTPHRQGTQVRPASWECCPLSTHEEDGAVKLQRTFVSRRRWPICTCPLELVKLDIGGCHTPGYKRSQFQLYFDACINHPSL